MVSDFGNSGLGRSTIGRLGRVHRLKFKNNTMCNEHPVAYAVIQFEEGYAFLCVNLRLKLCMCSMRLTWMERDVNCSTRIHKNVL